MEFSIKTRQEADGTPGEYVRNIVLEAGQELLQKGTGNEPEDRSGES